MPKTSTSSEKKHCDLAKPKTSKTMCEQKDTHFSKGLENENTEDKRLCRWAILQNQILFYPMHEKVLPNDCKKVVPCIDRKSFVKRKHRTSRTNQ